MKKGFKKVVAVCMAVLMFVGGVSWDVFVQAASYTAWIAISNQPEGYEVSSDGKTISISSPEALAWVSKLSYQGESFEGKTILLKEDIDMSGNYWTTIGLDNPFYGTFDGQNHVISGIELVSSTYYAVSLTKAYVGLFGISYGDIKNITVLGEALLTKIGRLGGIVAENYGTVHNCTTDIDITVTFTAQQTPTADSQVGGIVGYNQNGTISSCTSHCNFTATTSIDGAWAMGGIIGCSFRGVINKCSYSSGMMTGKSTYNSNSCASHMQIGGIAGSVFGNSKSDMLIDECTVSNSSITTESSSQSLMGANCGGIVGNTQIATLSNLSASCTIISNVNNTSSLGGLIGVDNSSEVSNSTFNGTIEGNSDTIYTGGITGSASNSSIYKYCSSSGQITGITTYVLTSNKDYCFVGGITGKGGEIQYCSSKCTLKGKVEYSYSPANVYVGGIVGYGGYSIKSSYSECLLFGAGGNSGTTNVGGISGACSAMTKCLSVCLIATRGSKVKKGAIEPSCVTYSSSTTGTCYYVYDTKISSKYVENITAASLSKPWENVGMSVSNTPKQVDLETVSSGLVAYALGWYQNLGSDPYPVLDDSHAKVYMKYVYKCDGIGLKYPTEYRYTNNNSDKYIDAFAHTTDLLEISSIDASCTEPGNHTHWYCSACEKYFSDSEGKNETVEESFLIEPLGHTLQEIKAKAPTITEEGNLRYWYCTRCAKYYSDEEAKIETTLENITIPPMGKVEHILRVYSITEDGQLLENIVEGGGVFEAETSVQIFAESKEGYCFKGWYIANLNENNECIGYDANVKISDSLIYTFKIDSDVNYVAVYEEITSKVTGYTLSLFGDIAVNIHMTLTKEVLSDDTAMVKVTFADGENMEKKVSELERKTVNSAEQYIFTCNVQAPEMTDVFVVELITKNGDSQLDTYSVKAYCDYVLSHIDGNPEYAEAAPVIRAMLNYGGYSQKQFKHNTDNLANAGLYTEDTDPVLNETVTVDDSYLFTAPTEDIGLQYYGSSLLLNSETTIRHYFTISGEEDLAEIRENYTFVLGDNVELTPGMKGAMVYVDIKDINAAELHNMFKLKVMNNSTEDSFTFGYSPLCYAKYVLENTMAGTNLTNVIKAMCLYNAEAKKYFN